jgi:hypothetical protein
MPTSEASKAVRPLGEVPESGPPLPDAADAPAEEPSEEPEEDPEDAPREEPDEAPEEEPDEAPAEVPEEAAGPTPDDEDEDGEPKAWSPPMEPPALAWVAEVDGTASTTSPTISARDTTAVMATCAGGAWRAHNRILMKDVMSR